LEDGLVSDPREQTARRLGVTIGNLQVVDNEDGRTSSGLPGELELNPAIKVVLYRSGGDGLLVLRITLDARRTRSMGTARSSGPSRWRGWPRFHFGISTDAPRHARPMD
jgi:hypothetical protein